MVYLLLWYLLAQVHLRVCLVRLSNVHTSELHSRFSRLLVNFTKRCLRRPSPSVLIIITGFLCLYQYWCSQAYQLSPSSCLILSSVPRKERKPLKRERVNQWQVCHGKSSLLTRSIENVLSLVHSIPSVNSSAESMPLSLMRLSPSLDSSRITTQLVTNLQPTVTSSSLALTSSLLSSPSHLWNTSVENHSPLSDSWSSTSILSPSLLSMQSAMTILRRSFSWSALSFTLPD